MDPRDVEAGVPGQSPVEPVELRPESPFRFDCHPSVACFNACCKSIDITLTPYDVLRLKRRLGMSSAEFVAGHTAPFEMDAHGMPGLKLLTKPGAAECVFLTEAGCGVYEDRPAACRYYALGNMGVRRMDTERIEDVYFVVREPHCLGHEEPKTRTVAEYREAQGVDVYDDMNREWRDIVVKKRSSGPTIGAPSPRSLQLFDMCSYDLDGFADFVESDGFRDAFDVDDDQIARLRADEEERLRFAMRFLKQVLFGERTIPMKEGARERRVERRKNIWTARRRREIAESRASIERQKHYE